MADAEGPEDEALSPQPQPLLSSSSPLPPPPPSALPQLPSSTGVAAPRRAPPLDDDLLIDSASITCREEAEAFYKANLVGERRVIVKGQKITIVFQKQTSHCFSVKHDPDTIPQNERIARMKPSGLEVRRFSRERAVLMGEVLSTIEQFSVAVESDTNVLVYGNLLSTGKVLRICLDKDTSRKNTWLCYSAYPVDKDKWLAAYGEKNAIFP